MHRFENIPPSPFKFRPDRGWYPRCYVIMFHNLTNARKQILLSALRGDVHPYLSPVINEGSSRCEEII